MLTDDAKPKKRVAGPYYCSCGKVLSGNGAMFMHPRMHQAQSDGHRIVTADEWRALFATDADARAAAAAAAAAAPRRRVAERTIWSSMIARCTRPTNVSYPLYGARGIRVCDRWLNSFDAFLGDMGPRPSPAHSLDRIDNSRGYEPSNCRWATWREQARNKSGNVHLTLDGRSMTISAWAEELGIHAMTLWQRVQKLGWTTERAIRTPVNAQKRNRRAKKAAA